MGLGDWFSERDEREETEEFLEGSYLPELAESNILDD